jgi:hypothetical protein
VARITYTTYTRSILVKKPLGKSSLTRPRRRREDNIKMDLTEMGYENERWLELARDRMRSRAPSGSAATVLV